MTSQRVERTWMRTGGYGRLRGEWVNNIYSQLHDLKTSFIKGPCKNLQGPQYSQNTLIFNFLLVQNYPFVKMFIIG